MKNPVRVKVTGFLACTSHDRIFPRNNPEKTLMNRMN